MSETQLNKDNNAIASSALETRIKSQRNQTLNLNEWIFSQIKMGADENVLELCCGTGAQTSYFSKRITKGLINCVDVNEESIELNRAHVQNSRINYIVSSVDDIEQYASCHYDLIFCAYGFYYSRDAKALHDVLKQNLNPGGRFVLVGPTFGNNVELYRIVEKLGFSIPSAVTYSSEQFMLDFLKIFIKNYPTVNFSRVINKVTYSSHEQLLNYWKNTTFYTSCPDKDFLAASMCILEQQVTITKSIAIVEGHV